MNNANMASMNPMGGPVSGGMPMMNNGLPGGGQRAVPVNDNQQRSQLNTYIYEYFLRNKMWDCARAIINSEQPINVIKSSPDRRRDGNGNLVDNGVSPDGADGDSKDDIDSKRPEDLPAPNLPMECPESCFLYEWWCLFWDMFNAQRGKGENRNIQQYVMHTQQSSRNRQEALQQQQHMIRNMRPDMMASSYQMLRNQQNGMGIGQNDIARKAMHNNRQMTPQQQILQQQQQQKQQQMQRDGSDIDGSRQQRPQSPNSVDNAPSPSKRPRLEGTPFNTQGIPNGGRQPQGIPGQQYQAFQGQNPANQPKTLQAYTTGLVQHQQSQMPNNKGMPNPGGPQSQGSPMMPQGQDGGAIATYYNAGEMGTNGIRPGPGGQPGGGNHALQDYQMQLMLLEQQNKKRLMMARQEQDSMGGGGMPRDGSGGPGGPGPNGQNFQGTSPQGTRAGSSPNPNDQMKRGTPQMNAAGIPSPLPEGRGSPGAMNFMPGQMDSMAPHFYKQINGIEGSMGTMPNRMQPPSSHPAPFNGQIMNNIARQQQQQGGVNQGQGWQPGGNGAPMMQQPSQVPTPQAMGTPQPRAMPPPSAPAAGAATNGRTQPPSPQQNAAPPTPSQANKANPKAKKDTKQKRTAKKGTTATGATPVADGPDQASTPTPATPITPVHHQSFANSGQNGGGQNPANGQSGAKASATAPPIAPPQSDPNQAGFALDDATMFNMPMDFTNPAMGGTDVLQDFDFDSFLHQDGGDTDQFGLDTIAFMDGSEVVAE